MYSGPIFGTGAERQERGGGRDSETRSAPPAPRWQETDVDETLVDLHKVDCNSVCPFKVPAPLPAPLPAQLTPGKCEEAPRSNTAAAGGLSPSPPDPSQRARARPGRHAARRCRASPPRPVRPQPMMSRRGGHRRRRSSARRDRAAYLF